MIPAAVAGGAALNYMGAQDAADTQANATNNAAAASTQQYNQNRADLSPYRAAGAAALDRLNKLLGISPGVNDFNKLGVPNVGGYIPLGSIGKAPPVGTITENPSGGFQRLVSGPDGAAVWQPMPADYQPPTSSGEGDASGSGSPLLRKFSQSDLESDPVYLNGLKFGQDEGRKAIERRAQASGGYDSGATLKALTRFASDYGSTKGGESYGRFRDWQDSTYGKLSGVAGMGSGATTVGVGAGTANATNLGNLYTGQGNAQAASTIAQGNAITGGINSGIGAYYLSQLSPGGQRGTTVNSQSQQV